MTKVRTINTNIRQYVQPYANNFGGLDKCMIFYKNTIYKNFLLNTF